MSALPPHLRFLLFSEEDNSSLTLHWCRDSQLKRLSSWIGPLAAISLQIRLIPCRHPAKIYKSLTNERISAWRRCKCRAFIVRREGLPCTLMTLTLNLWFLNSILMLRSAGADCSYCESFCLASLRSRIAFFSESDSAPRTLPFSSSQGPVRKKQQGRGFERPVTSEPTSDQCPRAEMDDSLSLAALDAAELSGSVTDPTLFPLSSSSNARLRMDEELIRVITKAVTELGLHLRSHLAAGWTRGFSHGAIKSPAKAHPPSSPKSMMSSLNRGVPPTRLSSVLLPPMSSPSLMALKRRDKSACPLWMSPWPRISARPRLSDGRRGQAIHPSHAEPLLHSLDAPNRWLDKWLRHRTLWVFSRSSRPRCSPVRRLVWMQLHSGIWGSLPPLVLECHLWFTMTKMKEVDKVPFLEAPVSSGNLFGSAVEGFAKRFTDAQKSSQAMRHFLPKLALLLLPVALNLRRLRRQLSQSQPLLSSDLLGIGGIEGVHARHNATPSRSTKDPGTRSTWIRHLRSPPDQQGRKRRSPSLATAGPPRKLPLMCLLQPRSALGAEESMLLVPHRPTLAPGSPTAVIADKIQHIHSQKT